MKISLEQFEKLEEIDNKYFRKKYQNKEIAEGYEYIQSQRKNVLLKRISENKSIISTITQFSEDILTYYNESIGVDIESFWQEIELEKLDYIRKDPLRLVLSKGSFRDIHSHMNARYAWDELKTHSFFKARYSYEDVLKIEYIIFQDEQKRLELLQKCLRLKKVSSSNYLRFGDAIAYFTNGKLIEDSRGTETLLSKYFTRDEINTLEEIWE